jgi:hypothetical protein
MMRIRSMLLRDLDPMRHYVAGSGQAPVERIEAKIIGGRWQPL